MSISSQKSDIFEKIAILKTASYSKNKKINTPSFNLSSSKDPFLFILDLLIVTSGGEVVSEVISTVFSILHKTENSFKSKLKKELIHGMDKSNPQLPETLKKGIKIHIYKIDPLGSLFVNDDKANLYLDDFKLKIRDSLKNPNTSVNLTPSIKISYDNSTGYLLVTPIDTQVLYTNFISNLIDELVFVDNRSLLTNSIGNLFNSKGLNKEQIASDEQIDIVLNKFITDNEEDDSYFTFNTGDIVSVNEKVEIKNQFIVDTSNGETQISLNDEDINNIIENKKITNKNIISILKLFSEKLFQTSGLSTKDKQSLMNTFSYKFILVLRNTVFKTFLLGSQISLLYNLVYPSNDNTLNPLGDVRRMKNIIKCLISELTNTIMSSIFTLLKKEIRSIMTGLIILYTQEGINKYKKIITSLFKR